MFLAAVPLMFEFGTPVKAALFYVSGFFGQKKVVHICRQDIQQDVQELIKMWSWLSLALNDMVLELATV